MRSPKSVSYGTEFAPSTAVSLAEAVNGSERSLQVNGDYLSDALAAQVGGIGIAPGGNVNYDTLSLIHI